MSNPLRCASFIDQSRRETLLRLGLATTTSPAAAVDAAREFEAFALQCDGDVAIGVRITALELAVEAINGHLISERTVGGVIAAASMFADYIHPSSHEGR